MGIVVECDITELNTVICMACYVKLHKDEYSLIKALVEYIGLEFVYSLNLILFY